MAEDVPNPINPKVWAGAVGAGAGGAIAALSASDVATFIVDLTHMQLSEGGARGLASIIAVVWSIALSAGSSFGAGYMKRAL